MSSLYDRLGGTKGITAIANDVVEFHARNPRIAPRFAGLDLAALKRSAAAFFITGTGGPAVYAGRDMLSAHQGMNIDHAEFMAVLDDALAALENNGVGQREHVCAVQHEERDRQGITLDSDRAFIPVAVSERDDPV